MQRPRRRTRLIYLAVIVGTAVVLTPICAALGYPAWLPLGAVLSIMLVAAIIVGTLGAAYVALAITALLLMFLVSTPYMWIREVHANRRLAASLPPKRRATWKRLDELAATTPGTLIREARSIGWSTQRIWWTPRDIAAEAAAAGINAPVIQPGDWDPPDPLTPFCMERYLHREHGDALLIDANPNPIGGARLSRRIRTFRAAHPSTGEQYVDEQMYNMLSQVQKEETEQRGQTPPL